MSSKVTIGLRVDPDQIPELEKLARLMTAATGGAVVSPTTAARAALARGVEVLRAELTAAQGVAYV